MLRRPRVLAFIAALSVAALAPGCGSDDSPAQGSGLPDEPSKQEYVAAADEICQQLYEQRDPLEDEAALAAQTGDVNGAVETFENAASVTQNRFAELEALPRPEGDEEVLSAIYERGARSVELARRAAQALADRDGRAFARASRLGAANSSRLNRAAIRFGFLVCGRGQSAEIG